ncbi:MAG: hypothetical protein VR68_12325 [Peptococcaceae bacterium BRH_c4a]|nr:MAG: hypothetical protein VR68_12325 [Peptococcaceae bacterium BRH_c4a]
MNSLNELMRLLNKLEEKRIYYRINKIRSESIMIEVVIPGQRWEIEFMENGTIEIEKFISDGKIYCAEELEVLYKDYSD